MIVMGVRSSWPASLTKARWPAKAPSRRSIISLKVCPSSATSSWPLTWMRWLRSVSVMLRAVSRSSRSGASTRPATVQASSDAMASTPTETPVATCLSRRPPDARGRSRPRRRRLRGAHPRQRSGLRRSAGRSTRPRSCRAAGVTRRPGPPPAAGRRVLCRRRHCAGTARYRRRPATPPPSRARCGSGRCRRSPLHRCRTVGRWSDRPREARISNSCTSWSREASTRSLTRASRS